MNTYSQDDLMYTPNSVLFGSWKPAGSVSSEDPVQGRWIEVTIDAVADGFVCRHRAGDMERDSGKNRYHPNMVSRPGAQRYPDVERAALCSTPAEVSRFLAAEHFGDDTDILPVLLDSARFNGYEFD